MSRMFEEIRQQPETLARTLSSELKKIEKFRALMGRRKPRLVVLAARGTSDNAAQFGRYLIEITTGIPVSLAAPSIHTLYDARLNYKEALVIAISQSGESTDTNIVLEHARKAGAVTVGITNEPKSALSGLAEYVFLVRAGRERSVAATKTYTGQLMVLYLIAYALGAKIRLADLQAIPDLAATALTLDKDLFAPSGPTWGSMQEMLTTLRDLKAETVVITDRRNPPAANLAPRVISVPARIAELYTPIPYIIPAQLFAAALAVEKNLDPDRPRSLSKVTRTL
ncbi:MAG: SIS domain-containing protein [Bryobacteraceae bacterium]